MSDQFIAEIRIFARISRQGLGILRWPTHAISQNTALFSLLGTTYGAMARAPLLYPTFKGLSPIHQGQGAGLSLRDLGETSGVETVTLLASELPAHTHIPNCNFRDWRSIRPPGNFWATDAAATTNTTPLERPPWLPHTCAGRRQSTA